MTENQHREVLTPEQVEMLAAVLAEFPDCGHRIIGSCRDCAVAALTPTVAAMLVQAAAERERALRERIEAVHTPDRDAQWCEDDGFSWPCRTIRALATPTPALCGEFIDTGSCGHSDAEHDALSDAGA